MIKKTALESICTSLLGGPIYVKKGYIKHLRIDIPWTKLLSQPCEMIFEEVHIVLYCPSYFDITFAKKVLLKEK